MAAIEIKVSFIPPHSSEDSTVFYWQHQRHFESIKTLLKSLDYIFAGKQKAWLLSTSLGYITNYDLYKLLWAVDIETEYETKHGTQVLNTLITELLTQKSWVVLLFPSIIIDADEAIALLSSILDTLHTHLVSSNQPHDAAPPRSPTFMSEVGLIGILTNTSRTISSTIQVRK